MKIPFWDRVRFLLDPEHLEMLIYEHNLQLVQKLNRERKACETERRYLWTKMQRMQTELIALKQETLRQALEDANPPELLQIEEPADISK